LAAYVLPADLWEPFIEDWRSQLNFLPAIKYLHTTDANALKGEFKGWTRKRRNRKLIAMAKVIQRFKPTTIVASVSQVDFDKEFKPFAPYNLKNPYFTCFYLMVDTVARVFKESGIEQSISFVFDEHGSLGQEAAQWYYAMRDMDGTFSHMLKSSPIFADDELVEPLQAADMLAWHVRRKDDNPDEYLPALKYLLHDDGYIYRELDAESLRSMGQSMSQIEGVEKLQTKKDWKELKHEIQEQLTTVDEPTPTVADLVNRPFKFLSRLINSKLFGRGDKS